MFASEGDEIADTAAVIRALRSHGADIDAVDAEGRTPLMLAAASTNSEAAAALLQCCARVGPPECSRCSAANEVRAGMQRIVVGMAAEAARLRRQQAALQQERGAWRRQQVAMARQLGAWERERAALEAARGGGGGSA